MSMNSNNMIASHVPAAQQARIKELADQAWSVKHPEFSEQEKQDLITRIKKLLKEKDAVLVSHYYVDDDLQELAEETGGCVADSLEMAKFGYKHPAKTVIVAGVRFMGETAKILSPEKQILMVEHNAECSLDLACPIEEFSQFCDQHPDRSVVVYANTSAAVKARADWVVTSSIALKVATYLKERGEKLIWAPDRFLGSYIQRKTGADMLLWQASCIVHEEFKAVALEGLMKQHPDAQVLVHPESPASVVALADVVGSTSQIINAAVESDAQKFIVATESGIFHKMKQLAPGKTFLEAPTAGEGASCESCAQCPWMKMNDLQRLYNILSTGSNEIIIDEDTRKKAERSIKRMVEFGADPSNSQL